MSNDEKYHLAQLRHAYAKLMADEVIDQPKFADGLIAPVITYLESLEQLGDDMLPPQPGDLDALLKFAFSAGANFSHPTQWDEKTKKRFKDYLPTPRSTFQRIEAAVEGHVLWRFWSNKAKELADKIGQMKKEAPVQQLGGAPEDLRNVLCGVIEIYGPEGASKILEYALRFRGTNAYTGQPLPELPPMPPTKDREPFTDVLGNDLGYLEGDADWATSNSDAITWLADNHAAIRAHLEGKS